MTANDQQSEASDLVARAQRHGRHRGHFLTALREPAQDLVLRGRTAIGLLQPIGPLLQTGRHRPLRSFGQIHLRPQPHHHEGHVEPAPQTRAQQSRQPRRIALAQQRMRQPLHLHRQRIVVAADAQEVGQALFQHAVGVAQHRHLALDQRNGAPAMRMAQLELAQHVAVRLEELGIALQPGSHLVGTQRIDAPTLIGPSGRSPRQ